MSKKVFLIILIIAGIFTFSCNTTKTPKEPGDDYIADVNSFRMDYIRCLMADNLGRPTAVDLVMYLYPRSNTLEIRWKSGINIVCWDLGKKERDAIAASAAQYLAAYNAGNLPEQKPSKKTAWWSGVIPTGWGVGGFTRTTDAKSYITYEYLEKGKPYFLIRSDPTRYEQEENVSSPKISIYLSPSQLENFLELISQEHLNAEANAIVEEAYEW